MKRKQFIAELKELNAADLNAKAVSLSQEIMKLRFRKASGQLEHSHRFREAKRNLARVLGMARQKAKAS